MAVKIKIDSADLPSGIKLKAGTLSINQAEIGSRTVLSFTLIDSTGLYHPPMGEVVDVYEDDVLIYSGTIDEPREQKINAFPVLREVITVTDWHFVADRHFINESYARQKAGDIIKSILTDYLAQDGIIEGTIEDGIDIGIINSPYIPASQLINEICSLTGYMWRINPDKSLDFMEWGTFLGDAIDEDSGYLFDSLQTWKDRSEYRNKQILRNVPGVTVELTEVSNPTPNGEIRTFYVRYPLAEKPVIEINEAAAGWVPVNADDVGILGVDTGKKWYWNKEVNSFAQDVGETELAIGDAVRLKYKGLYRLTVIMEDPIEIAARKAIEGGSGIYEDVQDAPNQDGLTIATEKATALLRKYGKNAKKFTMSSYDSTWKVGQICEVSIPTHELSGEYLVMSLLIQDTGNQLKRTATFVDGEAIGGWVKFFRSWLESTQELTIRENELIRKIQTIKESGEWEGSYNIKATEQLYPANNLYPSNVLYPGTITLEVTVDD